MKKKSIWIVAIIACLCLAVGAFFGVKLGQRNAVPAGGEEGVFCGDYWVPEGAQVDSGEQFETSTPADRSGEPGSGQESP